MLSIHFMRWTVIVITCSVCIFLGVVALLFGGVWSIVEPAEPGALMAMQLGFFHTIVNGGGLVGAWAMMRRKSRWLAIGGTCLALGNGLLTPIAVITLMRLRRKEVWNSFTH